ncbi:MAG: hypothetical protein WCK08_01690 [Betaproteobacteria bacterium]
MSAPSPLPPNSAQDRPLGLTVHDLPTPERASGAVAAAGRWRMLLILLVCAAPVIASYLTYYVIRPEGRRSFGELIDPQRPLPAIDGLSLQGQAQPLTGLKGQWLLLAVGGGACDASCQNLLYLQRQLRESLGREKDRLDRVWLISDDAPVEPALQAAMQGGTVLRVPSQALAAWLAPAAGQQLTDHLYLVDPMGHWMMRFPSALSIESAGKAKRDLERLLRASASWDQPGR